jgi:hypothetical protein
MPLIPEATLGRLLGSIEANNLVILCGAGLSIPAPSGLLSAVGVARLCYDRYQPIKELPVAMRDDISALAGHFCDSGELQSVFLRKLVPWNELVGYPNSGHHATGDFLACRAVCAVLSTNVDGLIEQWANGQKVFLRGAIEAGEVADLADRTAPLLKIHGCMVRAPYTTLWAVQQLDEPAVQERLTEWSNWIHLNLQGRDLLIVGFWSDWAYLNEAISRVMTGHALASVTVIDPLPDAELERRAPGLWTTVRGATTFAHVAGPSDMALEEIRVAFSRTWFKKFLRSGRPMIDASRGGCGAAALEPPDGTASDLYNMRKDAEGVPYHRAAQSREPAPAGAQAAYAQLLFLKAGASRSGAWFECGGKIVRIVNGGGELLSGVQARYVEPPAVGQSDVVVCAGAMDLGVPGPLIATGRGASTVRPGPGGTARWITLEAAMTEFGL